MNATKARPSDTETIKAFLDLPTEALPRADWVDDTLGSCWPYLRDYLRADDAQRLNHDGSPIRLMADRPEWREGVVVYAG